MAKWENLRPEGSRESRGPHTTLNASLLLRKEQRRRGEEAACLSFPPAPSAHVTPQGVDVPTQGPFVLGTPERSAPGPSDTHAHPGRGGTPPAHLSVDRSPDPPTAAPAHRGAARPRPQTHDACAERIHFLWRPALRMRQRAGLATKRK